MLIITRSRIIKLLSNLTLEKRVQQVQIYKLPGSLPKYTDNVKYFLEYLENIERYNLWLPTRQRSPDISLTCWRKLQSRSLFSL